MIVQSWGGEIHLLPALPKAWSEGAVQGMRARGGIELDLAWARGRPSRLALRGPPGQAVRLRVSGHPLAVTLDPAGHAVVHRFPA